MTQQRYPLHWPAGWPRSRVRVQNSQFSTSADEFHAVELAYQQYRRERSEDDA